MRLFRIRTRRFPMLSFTRAIKDHDLMAAFMHLHSIQDLKAHARFYARVGHPYEGHWPDRYWLDDIMLAKFAGSVADTYYAFRAIRRLLPPEALDLDHGLMFSPNHQLEDYDNPALLAQRFLANPDIQKVMTTNYLMHPEYVTNGLVWFFDCFKNKGIVNADIKYTSLLPPGLKIDGTMDLSATLVRILTEGSFLRIMMGRQFSIWKN